MIDPDNVTLRIFQRKLLRKTEFADNESTLFVQNFLCTNLLGVLKLPSKTIKYQAMCWKT